MEYLLPRCKILKLIAKNRVSCILSGFFNVLLALSVYFDISKTVESHIIFTIVGQNGRASVKKRYPLWKRLMKIKFSTKNITLNRSKNKYAVCAMRGRVLSYRWARTRGEKTPSA